MKNKTNIVDSKQRIENVILKSRFQQQLMSVKIHKTYSHFVSCLDVEHEVLNNIHLILGVDDVEAWRGAQGEEQ